MSEFALGPAILTGEHVRLEPLGMDHVPRLLEAARDDFARIKSRPLLVSTNELITQLLNHGTPRAPRRSQRVVTDHRSRRTLNTPLARAIR